MSALALDPAMLGLIFFWLSCRAKTRRTRPSLFDFVAQKNFSSTQRVCFITIASKCMKHKRVNPKLYTTKNATSHAQILKFQVTTSRSDRRLLAGSLRSADAGVHLVNFCLIKLQELGTPHLQRWREKVVVHLEALI